MSLLQNSLLALRYLVYRSSELC